MKRIDAIAVKQHSTEFYIFQMAASELFSITRINARQEGKEEGYQRVLSPGRVKSVTRYINSRKIIPGAIVVSFPKLQFTKRDRKLTIVLQDDEFGWIIDGQHRLAGACEAADQGNDIQLSVVAFTDLTLEQQIELFITINREAKNVPSSLYLDLLGELPKKKTEKEQTDERLADVARELNNDEGSPFYQRLVFTRAAKAGEISLTNFARRLRPLFSKQTGLLAPYPMREQVYLMNNYYNAWLNILPENKSIQDTVLFKTLGFGAIFRAFPLVFTYALSQHAASNVAAFVKIIEQIPDYDFKRWEQYGTGSAAETQAGDDLVSMLQAAHEDEEGRGNALKLD